MAAQDEDRHAVVVVAAPAASRLEGSPAGDDGPGRHELVDYLGVDAGQAARDCLVGVGTRQRALVQAVPAVAEPVARSLVGPGDESVERACKERLRTRWLLSGLLSIDVYTYVGRGRARSTCPRKLRLYKHRAAAAVAGCNGRHEAARTVSPVRPDAGWLVGSRPPPRTLWRTRGRHDLSSHSGRHRGSWCVSPSARARGAP
jgi:hypothetical protein